ncbi:MAG: hypothetical protein J0I80_08425 [Sphingomonas sp.]|nr:hypothetical protein [Sphingomonas sp.]
MAILPPAVESREKVREIPEKVSRLVVADRAIQVPFEVGLGVSHEGDREHCAPGNPL